MPSDEDKLREGIITVPPPEGEEDPYGAPTRVARVPDNLLDELMKARGEPARAEPPRAAPPPADAAGNDLSALAAAASHVVVPPRPRAAPAKPPPPTSALPLDARPPPAPPPLVDASMPTMQLAVQAIPVSIDEAELEDASSEAPGSPAKAPPPPPPMQSGRTVPLSAALLADVLKSVEDRRAAAAPPPVDAPVEAPVRKRRSLLALVLVLAIGLGVFITGVVMFLKALE